MESNSDKKIRVIKRKIEKPKPPPKRKYEAPPPKLSPEESEKVNELQEKVDILLDRVYASLRGDSERDFVGVNQGKDITIMLNNGLEKKGKLDDIGNFGIFLSEKNIRKYLYKHAIIGYYLN